MNIKEVLLLLSLVTAVSAIQADDFAGPKKCGNCHKEEYAEWKDSPHAGAFSESFQEIWKGSGGAFSCLVCHTTGSDTTAETYAHPGITCESCHGAARDWIDIHSDYGGKDVKKEDETAAHRKQRLAKSEAGGMLRPDDLYAVANNCYQCHLVPNEKLVFTWAWRTMPERGSLVTILFAPDGNGTLMTLIHEQFFDEPARDRHREGWTGCFDKLERFLA